MLQPIPDPSQFHHLRDRVVVLTGGASGIGLALTTLLHGAGAHVIFGDISRNAGQTLVSSLTKASTDHGHRDTGIVTFVPCDVAKYGDIYALFRTALDNHGRVDHAVSCAGIVEQGAYFAADLTVDSIGEDEGNRAALDVNLIGSCHFARIALPFLRHVRLEGDDTHPSLTFLSSVVALRDSPGMAMYQTSKIAILGLMRSMRGELYPRDGIRINAVCPGITESAMTAPLIPKFQAAASSSVAHYQTSMQVAQYIASVMLAKNGLNGKSLYIESGKAWEFEDGLLREMPRWLGEEPTKMSAENIEFLNGLGGIMEGIRHNGEPG